MPFSSVQFSLSISQQHGLPANNAMLQLILLHPPNTVDKLSAPQLPREILVVGDDHQLEALAARHVALLDKGLQGLR